MLIRPMPADSLLIVVSSILLLFLQFRCSKASAESSRDSLAASGVFDKPIVTAILPVTTFYPAEEYHQEYFQKILFDIIYTVLDLVVMIFFTKRGEKMQIGRLYRVLPKHFKTIRGRIARTSYSLAVSGNARERDRTCIR